MRARAETCHRGRKGLGSQWSQGSRARGQLWRAGSLVPGGLGAPGAQRRRALRRPDSEVTRMNAVSSTCPPVGNPRSSGSHPAIRECAPRWTGSCARWQDQRNFRLPVGARRLPLHFSCGWLERWPQSSGGAQEELSLAICGPSYHSATVRKLHRGKWLVLLRRGVSAGHLGKHLILPASE